MDITEEDQEPCFRPEEIKKMNLSNDQTLLQDNEIKV